MPFPCDLPKNTQIYDSLNPLVVGSGGSCSGNTGTEYRLGLGLGLGFYFGYTDWYKSQYFYYSLCLAIYPWQWKPQD